MDIHLTGEHYRCLAETIPRESPIQKKLTTAAQLENVGSDGVYHTYVIVCSAAEAQALLEVAKLMCPGAVADIERDIRVG